MLIGLAIGLWTLLFQSQKLGYLKIHLAYACFICSLFIPLFYGSIGTLQNWPNADFIFSYSWVSFIAGVILFYLSIFIADKFMNN